MYFSSFQRDTNKRKRKGETIFLKTENSNLHGFELRRPLSKGTDLLFQVIKAIINQERKKETLNFEQAPVLDDKEKVPMEVDHVALGIIENDLELDAADCRQVREQGAFSHNDAAGDSQVNDDQAQQDPEAPHKM